MQLAIFSYDVGGLEINQRGLDAFVSSNKFIDEWSFLYEGCFILKTSKDFEDLFESLSDFLGDTRFVLAKIESDNEATNGHLSKDIWLWASGESAETYDRMLEEYSKRLEERKKN